MKRFTRDEHFGRDQARKRGRNTCLVFLTSLTLEEYLDSITVTATTDYTRYDHPDRPLPTREESRQFWRRDVASGRYCFRAIRRIDTNDVVGYVNAFDFDYRRCQCEMGITIYPPDNFGRGYGGHACRLFLEFLGQQGMKRVIILTHPLNVPARALFSAAGFVDDGLIPDNGTTWQRMCLSLDRKYTPMR